VNDFAYSWTFLLAWFVGCLSLCLSVVCRFSHLWVLLKTDQFKCH